MRAKFGSDPTAGSKNLSFKFISRFLYFININTSDSARLHTISFLEFKCVRGWLFKSYPLFEMCIVSESELLLACHHS